MKVSLHFTLLVTVILTATISCNTPRTVTTTYQPPPTYSGPVYQQEEVNSDVFYNELSPYGRWVEFPQYGRVWICNQPGFAPYQTAGRWAYTDYGWTWVSDYSWGWAPFHYGRWISDPMYGWAWIPGNEWAPAWVSWRSNNNYYGWAPLGPDWRYNNGFGENIPYDHWCFVPNRYMCNSNLSNYYINRAQNVTIINNTTIINTTNIYRGGRFMSGPDRLDVERNIGRKVNAVTINNSTKPGNQLQGNNFNIYRPVVKPIQPNHPVKEEDKPVKAPVRPNVEPTRPNGNIQPNPGRPHEPIPNKPDEPNPLPGRPNVEPTRPNGDGQHGSVNPEGQGPVRPVKPNVEPTRPSGNDYPGQPSNNQQPVRPVRNNSNVFPTNPGNQGVNPVRPDRSNVKPQPVNQPVRNPGRGNNAGNPGRGNMPANNMVKHPPRTVNPAQPPRGKSPESAPKKIVREENRRD